MTKLKTIFCLLLGLVALPSIQGCSSDADADLLLEQQKNIVSFLTQKHNPRLISYKDVAESLDDDPEFYTMWGHSAYRYISDYYNTDRETRTEAKEGSKLTLTFWCYDFSTYNTPSESNLYFTNDPAYRDALEEAGLNTQYWSFEPLSVTLGKGDTLKAIEQSLVGCKEGDTVEIYLTYNLAYGKEWIGVTSFEEPIAFFCIINSIE